MYSNAIATTVYDNPLFREYQQDSKDALQHFDEIIKAYKESAIQHNLATYIMDRFEEAKQYRASEGVDSEMDRAVQSYNNQYHPEDAEMIAETSDIYAPLTSTKCRGLQNWIMDILANAEDKPWTLTPTPDPDIPLWMEDEVVRMLEAEIMENGLTADIVQMAREAKVLAQKHAQKMAADATTRMETRIHDQMLKSGWREQFRQFVDDLSHMPSAVMFGPTVEMRKTLRWTNGQPREVEEVTYVVRRVNPKDFYPAPGATDVQTAPYVCEVRDMSLTDMMDLMKLYGVDQSAVRKVLAQYPDGYKINGAVTPHRGPARSFETVIYYGNVDADILIRHGLLDVDPQGVDEMEIWVCGGIVLRALRNPYPLQRRPYHSTSFMKRPGKFWGTPMPKVLEHIQRMVNGAFRNLARDMAYSSGPLGEYDIERMVDEDRIEEFSPFRMFAVRPDYTSGGANAIRFQRLPSNANMFIGVYDRFSKEADDVSGIPAYVIGNPNVAGAGRTLGGLSLLMGNAAKGVKRVIADIDKDMIEPIITMFYMLNLLYSPDETIKADASVVARGASGLLQRELAQSRATEVLPLLINGANMGLVEPPALAKVMRDILVTLGYPADLVTDPDRQLQLMMAARVGAGNGSAPTLPQPSNGAAAPTLPPVTPPVTIDGRSAPPLDPSSAERI